MLYVGCGHCRAVLPLLCQGSFMHPLPVPVFSGPMGTICPYCGPLPPMFTCSVCGIAQMLVVPGAGLAMPTGPVAPGVFAPVVQANPGMGQGQIEALLTEAGKAFAKRFGTELGGAAFECLWSMGDQGWSS
jgi:hypothetical protein